MPGMQGGNIHPLAIAYGKRWPTLPETPSMAEAGFSRVEVPTWHALLACPGPAARPAGRYP